MKFTRGTPFKPTGNPAKRPPKLKGRVANDDLSSAAGPPPTKDAQEPKGGTAPTRAGREAVGGGRFLNPHADNVGEPQRYARQPQSRGALLGAGYQGMPTENRRSLISGETGLPISLLNRFLQPVKRGEDIQPSIASMHGDPRLSTERRALVSCRATTTGRTKAISHLFSKGGVRERRVRRPISPHRFFTTATGIISGQWLPAGRPHQC